MGGWDLFPVGEEEVKTEKVNAIALNEPRRDEIRVGLGQIQLGDEAKRLDHDLAERRYLLPPAPKISTRD